MGARVPARQLHIEHLGAFTALHRSEGVPERGLQHSAARGALELEGHLIGHRKAFKPAPSETVTRLARLRDPVRADFTARRRGRKEGADVISGRARGRVLSTRQELCREL